MSETDGAGHAGVTGSMHICLISQPAYCMLQHLGCLHVQQCGIFAACRASCPSHLHCTVAVHAARSCSGDYTIKRRADIPNNEVDCNAKNYKVRWCRINAYSTVTVTYNMHLQCDLAVFGIAKCKLQGFGSSWATGTKPSPTRTLLLGCRPLRTTHGRVHGRVQNHVSTAASSAFRSAGCWHMAGLRPRCSTTLVINSAVPTQTAAG